MNLVAREVVALWVVGSNSIWVVDDLGLGSMVALILQEVSDIVLSELAVETELHILDFLSDRWVIVVEGGLIDESFVQDTLEEEIEVGHESSVVSVLVLHEDGVESEVDLGLLWINALGSGESAKELDSSEEGNTPDGCHDSDLNMCD